MNIFEFATKMELDGKAYYEKLAEETSQAGVKAIFRNIAEDEQKHCDTIRELQAGAAVAMADSQVLQHAKNLFVDLTGDRTVVDSLKKSLDAYQHARKIEAESIRFYEKLLTKMTTVETAAVIQKIVAEEREHYNILDNLYDFTLAPQNYLAWAEFSNSSEL